MHINQITIHNTIDNHVNIDDTTSHIDRDDDEDIEDARTTHYIQIFSNSTAAVKGGRGVQCIYMLYSV